MVVIAGQTIPGDGEIVDGAASVDESSITGESMPVIREAGGDRSGVTGGTRVLSDRIIVEITAPQGQSFLDRMIGLVEGAHRQRTPNEIALVAHFVGIHADLLARHCCLLPMAQYTEDYMTDYWDIGEPVKAWARTCRRWSLCSSASIPTTIGGLLAAIGIAGMDRAPAPTSWQKAAKRSKQPAISTRYSWIRRGRSQWETERPPSSSLWGTTAPDWDDWPLWLRWPIRLLRVQVSSPCSKASRTRRLDPPVGA